MSRSKAPAGRYTFRTSIQLEPDARATLERLARHRDVSLAYIVREALKEYVERRLGAPVPAEVA